MRSNLHRVALAIALSMFVIPVEAVHASSGLTHGGSIVNPDPSNGVTPDVLDGQVRSFAQVGNLLVVGGTFHQVQLNNGPVLTRNYLFAFDVTTGAVSSTFVPDLDAKVETVEAAGDGASVFVGGYFSTVNGITQKRITKLNVSNGQRVIDFTANVTSGNRVMDMAVSGSRLYLGGQFTKIGSVGRSRLAAVDVTSGVVDPNVSFTIDGKQNGGNVRIQRLDLSPDGNTIVAIGNFKSVNAEPRSQIAIFDVGTSPATLSSWGTTAFVPQCASKFDSYMRDVDIDPSGTYFIVGTTGAFMGGPGAGVYCDSITRWELDRTGSGQTPTWREYTGGDTTWSVLSTGSVVYVGGHMRWMNNPFASDAAGQGSVARQGIAALDPLNGLPLGWDPRRDPRREGVFKFLATPSGLYFGSDSCCIAGERHERLAFFPLEGGLQVPAPSRFSLPNDVYQSPQTTGTAGRQLLRRTFNGTTVGATSAVPTSDMDWSTARGVFSTNGWLYYGKSNGTFARRAFDGTTLGGEQAISLNGLSASRFPVSNITGMFLDGGFLYYTVSGDSRLFYRYFTHQTPIVGAETFVANPGGVNWSTATGMTLADGRIYFSRSNGNLYGINFVGGAPVAGTENLISGPGMDGIDWRSRGIFVDGGTGQSDTTPPGVPGKPIGISNSPTSIDLSWDAATDDMSMSLTYRVYRDDGATPVATFLGGTTGTITFTDGGLVPASTHTYRVSATDGAGLMTLGPPSDVIGVLDDVPPPPPGAFFYDPFSGAAFAKWTVVNRLSIDAATGSAAAPSARADVTGQSAWAGVDVAPQTSMCASVAFRVSNHDGALDLMRFRTVGNGKLVKVVLSANDELRFRSDVSGVARGTGALLPSGWNVVELCGAVGPTSTWDMYLDGTNILNAWTADTGTGSIGRFQIGDNAKKTFAVSFDDVVLDGAPA